MSTAIGPALDLVELAARATAAARIADPDSVVERLRPLPGGQSGLTYGADLANRGGQHRIVLKVAPLGLPPVRNRDVLRQARLLRALSSVPGMPVPRVVFEEAGDPPAVPPLFAMTYVPGRSFEPHIDVGEGPPCAAEVIDARARHAARLLALLHRQRVDVLGLSTEPVTTLSDEISRWERALGTVEAIADDTTTLIRRLRATMPEDEPACIAHGDFRLGNTLTQGSRVVGIVDWEIWSVGDPRADLGWFLLCANASWHPTAIRDHPGMPPVDELLEEYRNAGGPATGADATWFRCLALTKMAASTALIAKHLDRSGDPDSAQTTAAPVHLMLERAAGWLDDPAAT